LDEADIMKLDEAGLHKRLRVIIAKIKRIDDDDPKEETDPRIGKLLKEGRLICKRLDPIVRERCRDDPASLAEWDEIIHSCDDLDEEDPVNSGEESF
jgi:hypothetical protein